MTKPANATEALRPVPREPTEAMMAVADALDAKRYRWLRSHPVFQVKELPNELELLDACIDRYMAGRDYEE